MKISKTVALLAAVALSACGAPHEDPGPPMTTVAPGVTVPTADLDKLRVCKSTSGETFSFRSRNVKAATAYLLGGGLIELVDEEGFTRSIDLPSETWACKVVPST